MNNVNTSKAYKEGLDIIQKLEEKKFQARFVGGSVRDRLLGIVPKDFDIAADAKPDEVIALLTSHKIKTIPTGIDHGTVTAVMPTSQIEITTLREDVVSYGRHAQVKFGSDFKKDAKRRDFTMNAMYEDKNGKVYDYFSGKNHLKEKKIFFVGDPKVRIKEDYLRILRFFRFKSRFSLHADTNTLNAIAGLKDGLTSISQERKTKELEDLFVTPQAIEHLEKMYQLGLWPYLLHFLPQELFNNDDFSNRVLNILKSLEEQKLVINWCLFVAAICFAWKQTLGQIVELDQIDHIWRELKIAKKEGNKLKALVGHYDDLLQLKRQTADGLLFIEICEKNTENDFFIKVCYPFWKIISAILGESSSLEMLNYLKDLDKKSGCRRKDIMSVTAEHIMKETGISSGPEIGLYLERLRYAYLDGRWSTYEEGIKYLQKLITKNKS